MTVTFGRYPYEEDGTERELTWRILTKEGGKALLITEDCIDYMRWSLEYKEGWGASEVRAFLNGEFLSKAFTDEERSHINPVENASKIITREETDPEKWFVSEEKVEDHVFLLDPVQARKYFRDDADRISRPTPYARKKGATDKSDWWLSTTTHRPYASFPYITLVWPEGKVSDYGFNSDFDEMVRPAVWVDESIL